MLIPLKVDVPTSRLPWVNYALIGGITLVSILAFYDAEVFRKLSGVSRFLNPFGGGDTSLGPEDLPLPVLALTASLLHAGWLHLIGNMLFLWIFGNAINYKFGQIGYLLLYAFCAFAGGMAHYGLDGRPGVGASGAIYGVMGAFLVFFPRNDVTVALLLPPRPPVFSLSSGWIIVYWIAWDVGSLILADRGSVALWAHVGGFVAGFTVALVTAATGVIQPTSDEETLLQVLHLRN